VAAPFGGLLCGFAAFAIRLSTQFVLAKVRGHRFAALDRPAGPPADPALYIGQASTEDDAVPVNSGYYSAQRTKFF
jgi:hypothetical protein